LLIIPRGTFRLMFYSRPEGAECISVHIQPFQGSCCEGCSSPALHTGCPCQQLLPFTRKSITMDRSNSGF